MVQSLPIGNETKGALSPQQFAYEIPTSFDVVGRVMNRNMRMRSPRSSNGGILRVIDSTTDTDLWCQKRLAHQNRAIAIASDPH